MGEKPMYLIQPVSDYWVGGNAGRNRRDQCRPKNRNGCPMGLGRLCQQSLLDERQYKRPLGRVLVKNFVLGERPKLLQGFALKVVVLASWGWVSRRQAHSYLLAFFARFFAAFFFGISERCCTGIASIRRAISSSGICGSSVCCFGGRALFMDGPRG